MQVVRAQRIGIRSVWPKEDADFTPWLADHLDWLADDLEFGPLSLEDTEVPIPGGRSLDILAVDIEGRLVAIENQYGTVDHDHLTRGLAYAVALQSSDRPVSALIVVAESHKDEFVAVADYLNECAAARADHGIRVFLVSVLLDRVGESPVAVRFDAVARPNDWEIAARRSQSQALQSVDEFLTLLGEDRRRMARQIVENWEAREATWLTYGVDSLVMYAKNQRVPQGRCHVASLYSNQGGTLWLNPGRLQESGAFEDHDLQSLAERIAQYLPPTTTVGGKGYTLAFSLSEVDSGKLSSLLDWIVALLTTSDL